MNNFIELENNNEKYLVNPDNIVAIKESSIDENHSVIFTTNGYEILVKGKYNHIIDTAFRKTKAVRAFETVISQTNMDADTYSRCMEKFTKLIEDETN